MVGIYRIRNIISKKSYYGSSKDIEKRFKRHRIISKNKKYENYKYE